jgi:hypothetical protein
MKCVFLSIGKQYSILLLSNRLQLISALRLHEKELINFRQNIDKKRYDPKSPVLTIGEHYSNNFILNT